MTANMPPLPAPFFGITGFVQLNAPYSPAFSTYQMEDYGKLCYGAAKQEYAADVVKPLQAEIARLSQCVEETASGPLSEEAMDIAYSKIDKQRKVLEQALKALQTCRVWRFGGEEFKDYSVDEVEDVIAAIQEVLK